MGSLDDIVAIGRLDNPLPEAYALPRGFITLYGDLLLPALTHVFNHIVHDSTTILNCNFLVLNNDATAHLVGKGPRIVQLGLL